MKKMARANAIDTKTIQFSITTDDADRARLIQQAKDFLQKGDKVKLLIRFRNRREGQMTEYAKNIMKSILNEFSGIATLDGAPTASGKELSCTIRSLSSFGKSQSKEN